MTAAITRPYLEGKRIKDVNKIMFDILKGVIREITAKEFTTDIKSKGGGNKMKKNVFVLALVVVLISLLTLSTALAAGKNGPAGKSNVGHLYLYEKIPGPVVIPPEPWKIVDGGAWGRMVYNLSGSEFDFVFNGHELAMGVGYTLIYYPDPWPGIGLKILGSGIADEGGDVHIKGKVATGDLPIAGDLNIEYGGAKIWLVLSDDLGPEGWRGWNPTEYLFENSLINFDGTP